MSIEHCGEKKEEGASAQKDPSRPLRDLGDQPVHIDTEGRVKLSDFEVKGTLGRHLLTHQIHHLINHDI
jgi:hypothetical protein